MSSALGSTIKELTITNEFLTGPGQDIVPNTLFQMTQAQNDTCKPFLDLFGPFTPDSNQQRWADYPRMDWSIRQLPVINVYQAESQEKEAPNGYLNGAVNIMTVWAPNQRRSDLSRVQTAYQGAIHNFFESDLVVQMIDEFYAHVRPGKVNGLNEFGKSISWSPNIEGLVEDNIVPVTLITVKYRVDLRAWYRSLEFQNRTKAKPFQHTLAGLSDIGGVYAGVNDSGQVLMTIPDNIVVSG